MNSWFRKELIQKPERNIPGMIQEDQGGPCGQRKVRGGERRKKR